MGPTTVHQVIWPGAGNYWSIMAIGLLFVGIGIVIMLLADRDGMTIGTTGAHLTSVSSAFGWVWVIAMLAATAIMGICQRYGRRIEHLALAIAAAHGQRRHAGYHR